MGVDYPLVLEPRYDERPWGGRRLATHLGKRLPDAARIGESWETAGVARVVNGPLAGTTLQELVERDPIGLLGNRGRVSSQPFGDFPLLAKFIDASETLSVQVHPDDAGAAPLGQRGKTEAWHILDAAAEGFLITGFREWVTPPQVRQALEREQLGDLLDRLPVSAGDTVIVPAGTVHAIGAGVLLYEIQETSDLTFRLYDWGRRDQQGRPRQLHVDEALTALRPELRGRRTRPLELDVDRTVLAACRYFLLQRWAVTGSSAYELGPGQTFHILSCIQGQARVTAGSGQADISAGQTALLPARVESVTLEGTATFLVSSVPDLGRDVVAPLLARGYDDEAIAQLAGDTHDLHRFLGL